MLNRLVRGAAAGFVATGAMSLAMLSGRAFGFLWTPPPKQITANVAREAGANHPKQDPGFNLGWVVAHFSFGSSWGAAYGLIRPQLPTSAPMAGLITGEFIWATNYAGILPAIGLYPPPQSDYKPRAILMIAAHAVYGLTLAETARLLLPQEEAAAEH